MPYLQAKHTQLPQLLLTFLTFNQLHCSFLHLFQPLNVVLALEDPNPSTVLKVWPHQCQEQGDDLCPGPAGHNIPDTGQVPLAFVVAT